MSSSEDAHVQAEMQPSTSQQHTAQDSMVKNIVATIMENQASTSTSMAKEAVMSQTERRVAD